MTSVLVKPLLPSAVAASDWLLSCQRIRDKARYQVIFETLYSVLKQKEVGEPAYTVFLDVLPDVFDVLAEAHKEGFVTIGLATTATSEGGGDEPVKVQKSHSDLLREAEDFLLFLLVFAKELDRRREESQQSNKSHETHVCDIVSTLFKIETSEDPQTISLRLRLLMHGFNFLAPESVYRYAACIQILQFTLKYDCFEQVLPYIHNMEGWCCASGHVVSSQRRKLFELIATQLKKLEPSSSRDQNLFIFAHKIVHEYDSDIDPNKSEGAQQAAAVELLVLAIRLLDVITVDNVMRSPSVQKLKDSKHAALYNLGCIFLLGDQKDLFQFKQKNPDFFSKYDLDYEACLEKLRLITVASMATGAKESLSDNIKNVKLSAVADRLDLEASEAEALVVRAISLGILDGKIDQLRGEVLISSALQRTLGRKEWELLAMRLLNFGKSVDQVIACCQKTAQQEI